MPKEKRLSNRLRGIGKNAPHNLTKSRVLWKASKVMDAATKQQLIGLTEGIDDFRDTLIVGRILPEERI
jgi:hypothetical protein